MNVQSCVHVAVHAYVRAAMHMRLCLCSYAHVAMHVWLCTWRAVHIRLWQLRARVADRSAGRGGGGDGGAVVVAEVAMAAVGGARAGEVCGEAVTAKARTNVDSEWPWARHRGW